MEDEGQGEGEEKNMWCESPTLENPVFSDDVDEEWPEEVVEDGLGPWESVVRTNFGSFTH